MVFIGTVVVSGCMLIHEMRRLRRKLNKSLPELRIMSTHVVVVVGTVVVSFSLGGARVVVIGATVDVVVELSRITGATISLSAEGTSKNRIKCK